MAHVLSDYDMAPASAAWPRVRSVRAGRWHAQPTASRLRGIQVRSRCACAPRISATLSCGAGRSRSGSCAPGLVASICARSASQPIPRNGVGLAPRALPRPWGPLACCCWPCATRIATVACHRVVDCVCVAKDLISCSRRASRISSRPFLASRSLGMRRCSSARQTPSSVRRSRRGP